MKKKILQYCLSLLCGLFCGLGFLTANANSIAEASNISSSNVEVYQLAPDSNQLMQSYVIRTTNGKLIVIDGGGDVDDSVPAYLPSALRAIAGVEDGEYFEVEAWFISHPHTDHYYELAKVLNSYTATSNYKINHFYFDIPPFNTDEFPYSDGEASYLAKLKTGLDNYASVNNISVSDNSTYYDDLNSSVINPTSVAQGLSITIDDVRFDVLQTWDKSRGGNANNQNIILKMNAGGQTVLFLGDSGVPQGNALLNECADKLKSDIVQTAHHGQDAVTQEVYEAIDAEINLWPTPLWVWESPDRFTIEDTRQWLNDGTDFTTSSQRNLVACLYEAYPSNRTSVTDWKNVKDGMKIVLPIDFTALLNKPTFNLESGSYRGAQQITLSTTDDDAEIYYTINGDCPTAASTKYTGPFTIGTDGQSGVFTIRAVTIRGNECSNVSAQEYFICGDENQTSNLMYNLPAASFTLGGNNGTKLINSGSFDKMANGDTSEGLELRINADDLKAYGAEKNVSITVDLGAVYNLKHFYMYSLQRFAGTYLIYDLSVSTDGENFTLVADDVNEYSSEYVTSTNTNTGRHTASMDIDGVGRYFKLDYVGVAEECTNINSWSINIYEMELYGYFLSSLDCEVYYKNKTVEIEEDTTVGSVLSDLLLTGNASVQYCDANGEVVTDKTRVVTEGDVIKIIDSMKTYGTAAAAGCYDAANVSFVDEYAVVVLRNDKDLIDANRNIYLDKNAADVVLPLSLGGNTVNAVKVNGVVKSVSVEKGNENLTLVALAGQLNYGENIVEITDSANSTAKFIVYKNVEKGEILYYDFDVNTWTKNGAYIVSNEVVDNGIDGKSLHFQKSSDSGTLFGLYPVYNEYGFAKFVFKANTEYILSFDIKVLSGTSTNWWCPIRFGDTGDVGYIYADYTWKVAGSNSLFSQVTMTPNEDGSYRFTAIFKTLANDSNTSLDFPNWGGACNIYLDNICIKPVNPDAVRIACVGDSITEASNENYSYPEQLQGILGYENYYVFNFGKSASNVLEAGVYPYRTHAAALYNHLKTWNPDIIFIQLGTNDGRWDSGVETYGEQAFIDDYVSLLNEFKGLADKVYINISPYAFGNEFGIHADEVNNVITALQGYIAYENDIDVIDVHSAVKACDRAAYFPDYIHGNDAGYGVIAQAVANGLNGATFVNKYHLAYALYTCNDKTSSTYTQAKAVYDATNATQKEVDAAYESIVRPKVDTVYKISFNVNGGEPIADMEYSSKSESVILPTAQRAHYTFGGWYEDSAFTQKVESISVNAEKNYELYAQWTPDTYTISFYVNGGTSVTNQTVAYNSKAVKPADPVQEGYTFGGWYLDVACTQAYDFDNAVTENVCLYAKWTENVPSENNGGCAGTITMLPICGLLVLSLGCVLVKRKSENQ